MSLTKSLVLCCAVLALAPRPSPGLELARLRYAVEAADGAVIPYEASHSLTQRNERITRILVAIHSSNFDARQYFATAHRAVATRKALAETLILAPQLFEREAIPGPVPPRLLFWRVSPFRGSSRAAVGPAANKVRLSSFAVLDSLLSDLTSGDAFPRLRDIVLVGHSAGGQMVQRYALVGKFQPPQGANMRYVVSAPSSYAYTTGERQKRDQRAFALPDDEQRRRCPDYNRWGYGLDEPYAYFQGADSRRLTEEYAHKQVFYLCGSRDADPQGAGLSTTCAARLQGSQRLQRMQVFRDFLVHRYGTEILHRHRFAVVAGVGHSGRGTITSPDGLEALFGPVD